MSHHDLDGLEQLRGQYPDWQFGTVWVTAASRPDARRLWASKDQILLTAWTVPELRMGIDHEESGR